MDNKEFTLRMKNIILELKNIKSNVHFEEGVKGMIPVLKLLYDSEKEITPKDIEEELCITSARTARVLNQLQDKNLISRIKSEANKKKTIIVLTEEGKKLALNHRNMFKSLMDTLLKDITDEERNEFLRIIEKMASNLKERNDK